MKKILILIICSFYCNSTKSLTQSELTIKIKETGYLLGRFQKFYLFNNLFEILKQENSSNSTTNKIMKNLKLDEVQLKKYRKNYHNFRQEPFCSWNNGLNIEDKDNILYMLARFKEFLREYMPYEEITLTLPKHLSEEKELIKEAIKRLSELFILVEDSKVLIITYIKNGKTQSEEITNILPNIYDTMNQDKLEESLNNLFKEDSELLSEIFRETERLKDEILTKINMNLGPELKSNDESVTYQYKIKMPL